jgi:ferric-dicitrate binding protein FerR (iron transport regulator)
MLTNSNEYLFEKFLENKCTPDEVKIVTDWLSSLEGQQFFNDYFNKEIDKLDSSDFTNEKDIRSSHMFQKILSDINKEEINTSSTRNLSRTWFKIAAAVLLPLLLTNVILWYIFGYQKDKISWQEVVVGKGEKLQMMFQDGTRVWLNSDSKLKYPEKFYGDFREVKLEGEAYFKVKKDSEHPFIVKMKNLNVKVLGTSFNIKAYADDNNITATLDEGLISLLTNPLTHASEYLLKPGQEAVFSSLNSKLSINNSKDNSASIWRQNIISFKDTPLNEVIKTLERWYNVKFDVSDPKLLNYTYTINFKDEGLKNVLFSLERITPIECKLGNGIVTIKRK